MTGYNVNNLGSNLATWMNQRFLHPILNFEGGWEYWLQIDFPAWIEANSGQQYDFRREVSGVIAGGRIDWLINSNVSGKKQTAVEIKAQTPKYENNRFLSGVKTDIDKLSNLTGAYRKIMLAAITDPALRSTLISHDFAELFTYQESVAFMKRDWT